MIKRAGLIFFVLLFAVGMAASILPEQPIVVIETYEFMDVATSEKIESALIGQEIQTHIKWTTYGRSGNITFNELIFFGTNKTAEYSRWTPYTFVPSDYPGGHIYTQPWQMPNKTITCNITAYHNQGDVQFPGYIDEEKSIQLPVTVCGDVNYDLRLSIVDVIDLYFHVVDPGHVIARPDLADMACDGDSTTNINDVMELYFKVVDPNYQLCDGGLGCI